MRLTDFIERDMDRILAHWEAFAATRLPAATQMKSHELRDHARQILEAVVTDLRTPQTRAEQSAKSKGLAPRDFDAPETAAQTHAVLRAKSGFNINQLASEYRALRASVLRLWMDECAPSEPDLEDMIRFNEAIDQALAESVEFFSAQVERARNLLLGMLGHDLRSPLQTIQVTAQYLRALDARPEVSVAAQRLINSGSRMQTLLDDLVDYNRTKLGLGLRITLKPVDLAELCAAEIDQIRACRSTDRLELQVEGDCRGEFDGARIQQLLANLVNNALNYGTRGEPVRVKLVGDEGMVRLTVSNQGQVEPEVLRDLFAPLRRGDDCEHRNDAGLGLGLYIASEVVRAHGGYIDANSDGSTTTFTVELPRYGASVLKPGSGASASPALFR